MRPEERICERRFAFPPRAPRALRRLTLYQVHAHDAATSHDLASDGRLAVYERILLARARDLRHQSAQEHVFACEPGGLKHDIGHFGERKWIVVREINGDAEGKASFQ